MLFTLKVKTTVPWDWPTFLRVPPCANAWTPTLLHGVLIRLSQTAPCANLHAMQGGSVEAPYDLLLQSKAKCHYKNAPRQAGV